MQAATWFRSLQDGALASKFSYLQQQFQYRCVFIRNIDNVAIDQNDLQTTKTLFGFHTRILNILDQIRKMLAEQNFEKATAISQNFDPLLPRRPLGSEENVFLKRLKILVTGSYGGACFLFSHPHLYYRR